MLKNLRFLLYKLFYFKPVEFDGFRNLPLANPLSSAFYRRQKPLDRTSACEVYK